jgi:hypothetical protein
MGSGLTRTTSGSHLDGPSAPLRLPRGRAAQGERRAEVRRRTIVLDTNVLLDKNLSVFL